ncbi:MAG: homoserine dehydrogenase [Candidatus Aureabacteria bacterium]|nr:homoserine dehydrogenase [Candidatus Auribacterota bacterium]
MKTVNIGLIGLGTVGTGLVKALNANGPILKKRLGIDLNLLLIAEKNWRKARDVKIPLSLRASGARALIADPRIDIVVELIGGCGDARSYIVEALKRGKHVVTANKALLAAHGEGIFEQARRGGLDLYYEASVCGAIPIIKTIREGLASNRISSIFGIVNGTCNYILSRMTESGMEFAEALGEAQRLGYAEANPALDIEGDDSAHKLAILATLASGLWIPLRAIYTEGITHVSLMDIRYAREFDRVIKLLAIFKRQGNAVEARVHPTLIPARHLLASVSGAHNAVCVNGHPAGEIVLYGSGAGQDPTASAVLSDIIDIALNIRRGCAGRISPVARGGRAAIKQIDEIETQYYLRFSVIDRPGVLAGITGILGRLQIGIASVIQTERGGTVPVVIMTHRALERNVRKALARIDRLPFVKAKTTLIRVEENL